MAEADAGGLKGPDVEGNQISAWVVRTRNAGPSTPFAARRSLRMTVISLGLRMTIHEG